MHPTISEEAQDFTMSSDGESGDRYHPPPHIAARIFKTTANRRKSSAASSRRNSITSHHSSRSARSGHGRAHSTHIAQHLRRASIIEGRKAKAADRNAHAEQVRLRAAMNKAAPRVTSNSMERALAAQKAREKYLAQVKANCAEEVKRSKRVAEEQREKRAAELLKLREEMEERHAEAEKRKNLLQLNQRRPRTSTLQNADDATVASRPATYQWKPHTPVQAAPIIQNAWRKRRWNSTVKAYKELGLTVENIRKSEFEEVGELLSRDHVLSTTGKILQLLGLKDYSVEPTHDRTLVRTFLTTYLILGHPAYVLSKEWDQEQDLTKKAEELLSQFERVTILSYAEVQSPSGNLASFAEAFTDFQTAFSAWRSHDSSIMISGMVAQFVELDAIWQTVKDDRDGAVAEDYKEGIQHNQTLVLVRLKKLVGHEKAMQMIKDAIRTSRKARTKKKRQAKADDKPRSATVLTETPVVPTLDTQDGSSVQSREALDPASFLKSQLETSSLVPPNRVVTHEIAINKEWKIDTDSKAAMQDDIVASTTENLHRGFEQGLGDIWIPAIAEIIRDNLLGLLRQGNSLHNLISEALDSSMIANQVKHGAFSYDRFFAFMNNILPQLCAPVRDSEVKALATNPSEDPAQQLARLYYVIDIIRLDMLNFTLHQWAPTLLKESAGYEARCFSKDMEGKFPDRTLAWWKASSAKVDEELARRSSDSTPTGLKPASANKIYMQGLTDLAIGTTPLGSNDLPETLLLDHSRMDRFRADLLRIVTVSSILLTAKNLLRRDVRSLWKSEAQRMWDLPLTSAPSAFVSIVESRYALPPSTKQQLSGTINRLLADTKDGQLTHPVTKVLLKKIKAHVLTRLSASSAEERIRASTMATEVLGSGGLPEFVARVSDIVTELAKVADVDRESHGEWYEKIVQRAGERTGSENTY